MGIYFGTDGIRGKFNEDLTTDLAYKVGNALASTKENLKIVIGRDTRLSGDVLTLAFSTGAMNGGANVTSVGICPTATISYLTTKLDFDYGVIITASHNPAEYNGIKIFDKTGIKLDDFQEDLLEIQFSQNHLSTYSKVGHFFYKPELVELYIRYLSSLFNFDLTNKKIILDCSNGASSFIAKKIFKSKNANVISMFDNPNGININDNCGALHTSHIQKEVINQNADYGFAYDGDSDRLIAINEKGEILSGDVILYIFATYFKNNNGLNPLIVVGTKHTNKGIENELLNQKIHLIRADVGDKYVIKELIKNNLMIGGEQSGHLIVKKYLPTGDGILNSLLLTYICETTNIPLSYYSNLKQYLQINKNIIVSNKKGIMNSTRLLELISQKELELGINGRILVRCSGTEPCIRIMVESNDYNLSEHIVNEICSLIKLLDN